MECFRRQKDTYLIFGGTGSLGRTLVERLLKENKDVVVFSRDEAKHHRLKLLHPRVKCIVGDVRDFDSVLHAIRTTFPKYIINASAMKQVPLCEEYPYECVLTNTIGTHNICKAVYQYHCDPHPRYPIYVLSVSTDKACKPVSSYGMTKALQERIHLRFNVPNSVVHNCVRYGNVIESTGSVIPLFKQIAEKEESPSFPVTDNRMTRFLLSLNQAVDLIFVALKDRDGGKIFIPKVKSSKIEDVARALGRQFKSYSTKVTGIRPGEKLHEILISEEELARTKDCGDVLVVHDVSTKLVFGDVKEEYSSGSSQCLMNEEETYKFLKDSGAI